MYIYGAKFQEHCFNIFRDIVYSVFYHFQLQTIWCHHLSNLHNRKTSISLKRTKIFQKEKRHSSVFWKAFQISRKYFSCHRHFKGWIFCTLNKIFHRLWAWYINPLLPSLRVPVYHRGLFLSKLFFSCKRCLLNLNLL